MNKEIEKLNRLITELTADKTHLIQSAMDGGDIYHYTAHDIGYRDLERECKHLQQRIAELEWNNSELKDENAELKQRVTEMESECRWIPVSERLPECGGEYLIFWQCKYGRGIEIDVFQSPHGWHDVDSDLHTHWMPLPELPEVKHE